MKVRDSGMPGLEYWESFFDVDCVLERMRVDKGINTLVEFGCGYGTFTVPAALRISGVVTALDIDGDMLRTAASRIYPLENVSFKMCDITENGTGLEEDSADYVMLFNILHHGSPAELLDEAFRILRHGGIAGLVHWNYDAATPRGPALDIRPKPGDMLIWAVKAGFNPDSGYIDLPPYHYGYVMKKL